MSIPAQITLPTIWVWGFFICWALPIAGGGIAFCWKMWNALHRVHEGVEEIRSMPQRMETLEKGHAELSATVKEIRGQVFPNGGSSMNDRQVKLEASIDDIRRRLLNVRRSRKPVKAERRGK